MNGKVATSCLLFLLSDWAHAAESNLRGGSRSLALEPEQLRLAGEELNPFTALQPDATQFPLTPTQGSQFGRDGETTIPASLFQFSKDFTGTTTSPSIPADSFQFDSTELSQSSSPNPDTEAPSLPEEPFRLDPTKVAQFGFPDLDADPSDDGKVSGGFGLLNLLVGSLLVEEKESCPKGAVGTPCTREYAPLSCDGCVYNNSCLAVAAGFSKGQCKRVPVP
jgi:hypothetical protein